MPWAPDFFTDADIKEFFATHWEVHYNSSRTGVRLNGPKPQWARKDGGEAGLHPSNIHDNAYAFGTVDLNSLTRGLRIRWDNCVPATSCVSWQSRSRMRLPWKRPKTSSSRR